jgi:hypothetical protein
MQTVTDRKGPGMIGIRRLLIAFFVVGVCAMPAASQLARDNGGALPEPSRCITEATAELITTPPAVDWGSSTNLQWQAIVPPDCPDVKVSLDNALVAATGTRSVTPTRSQTYRLIVSERRGPTFSYKEAKADVSVRYPPRVAINSGTLDPAAVLVGALQSDNPEQLVILDCNVDINMTGLKDIRIGDNRTLIASPECMRSLRKRGPRIFVTDTRGGRPLFVINGDNVRISGFQLRGPTDFMAQGDRKEKGIIISPTASPAPLRNVEISNMEIYHWSGLGIQVVDNIEQAQRGRLFNTNEGAVRIRTNYFHHNRHGAGEGYGVVVGGGGYALIERNAFDENRHAIAGGSKHADGNDYSGYTARDNFILAGGGRHCADSGGTGATIGGVVGGILGGIGGFFVGGPVGAVAGAAGGAALLGGAGYVAGTWCWSTHQIDMHGDDNRWYGEHNWQCGTAGETMMIQRNTILYTKGPAIKIRGNPADKAVVDANIFKNDSRSDAIEQNGACGWGDNITKPVDVRPNNVFGHDPTQQLGSCDFAGDGQKDQFMATGVTWWAKSPVTNQWYYLNTMSEKLPQLRLADFDGDRICDVAPPGRAEARPRIYSKSGRSPWMPLSLIGPS